MRLYNLVLIILSFTASGVVVARDVSLYARQEGGTTASAILSDVQSTSEPLATIATSTSSASENPVSTTASTSTSMINIQTDIATERVNQPTAVPFSTNATKDANALPIEPVVTPALGVAGVLLIVLGICYNLIGIKNHWIHVFLSAAFSTSLSVTVLIVYVMSPPVRNAIQGAYFVAAFFTGVIFGALSLVFKELIEGLGCVIGGFCLSMWILCLKAGGLFVNSGTKGGFIGAFCGVSYALSFSSYTRPYALIGSTAFAGATAAVLGIDCFSRAGLKEFWLYIWDLNDNIFPLNTQTYPVTRGIRVELAVIVVICLMGLLSQFRLWRVVRERRKKRAALQEEEQKKKDEAEAEMGRKFEEDNMRELARWEAVYGSAETPESTSGMKTEEPESSRKNSTAIGVAEAPGDTVEMTTSDQMDHDLPQATRNSEIFPEKDTKESVHDSTEPTTTDEKTHEKEPQGDAAESPDAKYPDNRLSEQDGQGTLVQDGIQAVQDGPACTDPSPSPPTVTPLPFKVPDPADIAIEEDGHSVHATVDDAASISTRLSKRLSNNTLFQRLSNRYSNRIQSASEEMLVPIQPASPASSVLGIADGDDESEFDIQTDHSESDTPQEEHLSAQAGVESRQETEYPPSVQEGSDVTPKTEVTAVKDDLSSRAREQKAALQNGQVLENSLEVVQEDDHLQPTSDQLEPSYQVTGEQQVSPGDGSKADQITPAEPEGLGIVSEKRIPANIAASVLPAGQVFPLSPVTSTPSRKSLDAALGKESVPMKKVSSSGSQSRPSSSRKASLTAGAVGRLPTHVSPVVMSYRTNEWAKHLSEADTPELEPIHAAQEDTVDIAPQQPEVAAPVNMEELQQTATDATPPPAKENRVSIPEEPVTRVVYRSPSEASKRSAHSSSPIYSHSVHADAMDTKADFHMVREPSTSSPNLLLSASARSSKSHIAALHGLRSTSSPYLSTSLATAPIQESEEAHFPETPTDEPPSLLAQRESMIRSRMSTVSLTRDSWLPRSSSRQSLEEGRSSSRRASQQSLIERDDDYDDIPLAQRRALLQLTSHGRMTTTTDAKRTSGESYSLHRPSREHPNRAKSQLTMATWRESLREDLTRSQNPLPDVNTARTSLMEHQRKAHLATQQRKRASEYIGNSIAEKMQRGEMNDLHREAMRRMQAAANKKV